jgi:hypothetical protein
MSTSPQHEGKLAVPSPVITAEDYVWGSALNTPFDNDTMCEEDLEYPAPEQQCKSETPPPTLTSRLVTATVQQYTFHASDLFDIEDWIMSFCADRSDSRIWSWSWNVEGGISEMSEWLSEEGMDVDGDVRVFVKGGTLKLCVGETLVLSADGQTE